MCFVERRKARGIFLADRHAVMPPARKGTVGGAQHITDGRIARVLFCVHKERMVLLHAFIKKTQKTPPADIDLATRRRKELT